MRGAYTGEAVGRITVCDSHSESYLEIAMESNATVSAGWRVLTSASSRHTVSWHQC